MWCPFPERTAGRIVKGWGWGSDVELDSFLSVGRGGGSYPARPIRGNPHEHRTRPRNMRRVHYVLARDAGFVGGCLAFQILFTPALCSHQRWRK
jgi:hypothetical protein